MAEPNEIFEKLECNDTDTVERARAEIYGLFQTVREPWVIHGLYDYYLKSNSLRSMEILANVNEPHHKYLFDRINESIKRQETELKVKALTLLGHIVRKQPTWIYKIHDHPLMREILSVLKTEDDILALISALLLVIVLMPMIPSLIANYLQEIFDIFSRLAAWNLGTGALCDKQMMMHMQISLYALFLRLYGMYPCNFIAYLQVYYKDKNNPVFIHTIQPMLETVRMQPRLVTSSREIEVSAERWKRVGSQQIISECEQFYVDVIDKCPHDCCYVSTGVRSRSNTNSSMVAISQFPFEQLGDLCTLPPEENKPFFSPSMAFPDMIEPVPQLPPPPTTTYSMEFFQRHFMGGKGKNTGDSSPTGSSPPETAIEATPETTPVRDTRTPAIIRSPHIGSSVVRGITSFTKNRSANTTPTHSQPSSPMRKEPSPFNFPSTTSTGAIKKDSLSTRRLQKMMKERSHSVEPSVEPLSGIAPLNVPSSPVKIVVSAGTSRVQSSPSARGNEEVKTTVAQRTDAVPTSSKKSDVVLKDDIEVSTDETLKQGSPCSQGGLHMPNSKSMNDFAKRVQRLRYYSQNYDRDPMERSSGSSPEKGSSVVQLVDTATVRRAHSCPEIKKKSPPSAKDSKPLKETEEEITEEVTVSKELVRKTVVTQETQTEDSYMPYEHLFVNIFPCLGNNEMKSSPSSSPMPIKPFGDKESQHSVYNVIDRYMEIAKGDITSPSVQIQLLQQQLLFERYRRETFSNRNRKLIAEAKNIKVLEEYNSALKDTIQLQQRDVEYMTNRLATITKEHFEEERRLLNYKRCLEERIIGLQDKVDTLQFQLDKERQQLAMMTDQYNVTDNERQQVSNALFEAYAELKQAKVQAAMGERARLEVERLHKEILLMGELQLKYQEKLALAGKAELMDAELDMLTISYKEEVRSLKSKLDTTRMRVDAYRNRVIELESMISQKDDCIAQLKKNLAEVNSENHEKLKAMDSRMKSQLTINAALDQKILELYSKIEAPGLTGLHSPETSSCQEAMPSLSSLSASLASSESNISYLSSDIKDVKNLQLLVDKKTETLEDPIESGRDTVEMLQELSISGTQQQTSTSGIQQPSTSGAQQSSSSASLQLSSSSKHQRQND